MGELFFGTPTHLAKIAPSYVRAMDEEMPILHLSDTLEARNLDPYREVDKIGMAIVTLKTAANEFQEEVSSKVSSGAVRSMDVEVENMLLEKMAPLRKSRQAILDRLERLAGDDQICVYQPLRA